MCACTCLRNCRKVMTTCLFYELWVLVWCVSCLSLPLYSLVILVFQFLERTRLLLMLAVALRRYHTWSLAGFPSQSNVYNKVLKIRKSGLCPSAWHTHSVSLRLIIEPKLSKMSCKTEKFESNSWHLLPISIPPLVSVHTFTCIQASS